MTANFRHLEVYREPGRFAAWPANYGIWHWGDEIVLGFTCGHLAVEPGQFHQADRSRSFETMQARSLDGGETWRVSPFPGATPGNRPLSADEHMRPTLGLEQVLLQADCENAPRPCPGGLDFTDPELAIMCAKTGIVSAHGVRSFFYTSTDRCHHWDGPYSLPMFGQTGVAARTDFQALSADRALFFLTANREDGSEGQVFCALASEGGAHFEFLGHIGADEPAVGWAIMPASLQLPNGRILVARRCGAPVGGDRPWTHWIDMYSSDDQGATWQPLSRPAPDVGKNGNPPALTRLPDGRLCIIYGHRDAPFGIHAVLSVDDGASWSAPIVLRDDAGCADLGYPRAIVRPDGTIVTAYYYQDEPQGERYIAATLWKPEG